MSLQYVAADIACTGNGKCGRCRLVASALACNTLRKGATFVCIVEAGFIMPTVSLVVHFEDPRRRVLVVQVLLFLLLLQMLL